VRESDGPRGTNRYRVVCYQGVQAVAGAQAPAGVQGFALQGAKACTPPLQRLAPKPSENHQEPERGRAASSPGSGRGSRLDSNWQPSDADLAFCRQQRPDLDPQTVAATFRDHWAAKTGKDATKQDWPATWRNWVRRERAPIAGAMGVPRRKPVLHADEPFTGSYA